MKRPRICLYDLETINLKARYYEFPCLRGNTLRGRARFSRRGSVRFSGCCNFGDRCGFVGKIDLLNSPKTSANPYYDQQNSECDENQATFPETAHPSFWRQLKLGIHFRGSMWILRSASINSSESARNNVAEYPRSKQFGRARTFASLVRLKIRKMF